MQHLVSCNVSTGQRFDKDGILRRWWTTDSINAFKERQQCFAEQYSQYEMFGFNVSYVWSGQPASNACAHARARSHVHVYDIINRCHGEQVHVATLSPFSLLQLRSMEILHWVRTSLTMEALRQPSR